MSTTLSGTDTLQLPAGFRAAGIAAGIKQSGAKDLALLVSDPAATVAGVFTCNQVTAAPVKWCRAQLAHGRAAAVIVNSGNANACTGAAGQADTQRTAALTAQRLDVPEEQVFVCSTGPIGVPLPMDAVAPGIDAVAGRLAADGGLDAAAAILTTDLQVKHWTVRLSVGGRPVTVSGIAKGAGMIEPNMATMLAFVMTDAAVEPAALQRALTDAVGDSFNRITVDGDQSTNDTVLLLANGAAGHSPVLDETHPDWPAWRAALREVCLQLALKIVDDGEGARKRVTVAVEGAATDADAERAARAVANSFLVKTSWAGARLAWGRVMDAIGYSGATVREEAVDIWYDDQQAAQGGVATGIADEALRAVLTRPTFTLRIDLHLGAGRAMVYTCDITEEYVRINVV
jgi:glutamate N-acetyltransferase / amino-acid N-acetyltransferase